MQLDRWSIRSSLKYGLGAPYRLTKRNIFYPVSWHFDNGAKKKIDDVLIEHGDG